MRVVKPAPEETNQATPETVQIMVIVDGVLKINETNPKSLILSIATVDEKDPTSLNAQIAVTGDFYTLAKNQDKLMGHVKRVLVNSMVDDISAHASAAMKASKSTKDCKGENPDTKPKKASAEVDDEPDVDPGYKQKCKECEAREECIGIQNLIDTILSE